MVQCLKNIMDKNKNLSQAVVFIHGRGKQSNTWNISEFGKAINIELTIAKKVKTLLIQVDDFSCHPLDIISSLLDEMKNYRWIVVCHSLGIIYCYELLKHLTISGICLVDCTDLSDYRNKIITTESTLINYLETVEWNIPNRVICHVHFNYEKSKIMIHPNKSHMLHYTDAPKIIDSIMLLLSYK